ncbi:hypothetical protein DITRI_Ditri08aG0127300 [Diplodiscus trichospermus]
MLKADLEHLLEGFKSNAFFDVTLNVTKALTLPADCKVSAQFLAGDKKGVHWEVEPAVKDISAGTQIFEDFKIGWITPIRGCALLLGVITSILPGIYATRMACQLPLKGGCCRPKKKRVAVVALGS